MEKRYAIVGQINADKKDIAKLLKEFFNSKISERYAMEVEHQITIEDNKNSLFLHEASNGGYFLHGISKESTNENCTLIFNLHNFFKEKKIHHDFAWNQIDEDENEVGEEFEISFYD